LLKKVQFYFMFAEGTWLELVTEEDAAFIKRFILCSGSLKELAGVYGVSYPTLRLRLDRLIEKIRAYDHVQTADAYEKMLRGFYAEGAISEEAFKSLLSAYKQKNKKG